MVSSQTASAVCVVLCNFESVSFIQTLPNFGDILKGEVNDSLNIDVCGKCFAWLRNFIEFKVMPIEERNFKSQ